MKFLALLLSLGVASAVVHPVNIYGKSADHRPGEYLVGVNNQETFEALLSSKHAFEHPLRHWKIGEFRAVGGLFSEDELDMFRFNEGVDYIHNNMNLRFVGEQLNPPSWGLDRSDQRTLPLDNVYRWTDSANGQNVNVYVLDTGIFTTHEDWAPNQAIFGIDCSALFGGCRTTSGNGTDPNGHGSHCAGTIASPSYGIAKSARVIDVKVISALGLGSLFAILDGIQYAVDDDLPAVARVVSMSLGGAANPTIDNAVNAAVDAGVIVVAAAGNDNADACNSSPAAAEGAITVGASDENDSRAAFSNFGTCVDVFAPGVNIVSTANAVSGVNIYSGTSMACPHVAGAVAAIASRGITDPEQIRQVLVQEATPDVLANVGAGSPNLLLFTNPMV